MFIRKCNIKEPATCIHHSSCAIFKKNDNDNLYHYDNVNFCKSEQENCDNGFMEEFKSDYI